MSAPGSGKVEYVSDFFALSIIWKSAEAVLVCCIILSSVRVRHAVADDPLWRVCPMLRDVRKWSVRSAGWVYWQHPFANVHTRSWLIMYLW